MGYPELPEVPLSRLAVLRKERRERFVCLPKTKLQLQQRSLTLAESLGPRAWHVVELLPRQCVPVAQWEARAAKLVPPLKALRVPPPIGRAVKTARV